MSLIVKICGLSTRETLDVALDAGADMVGFVFFPPSPRHLSLEAARDLGKQVNRRASKVALTVDADDSTLANIVEALQPDILQLHGEETVARLRDIKQKFGLQVMKVVAVECSADLASLPGYAGVADRIPGGVDSAGQRRFGDDTAVPDRLDQIVLADDPLAVLDQIDQQVEHLRPHGDRTRSPGKFPPVGVENAIFEQELHFGTPAPYCCDGYP